MTSRAMRPLSLTVPPETFRLVATARMSFSDALVLRGISGRSSTRRSSSLLASSRLRSLSTIGPRGLVDHVARPAQEVAQERQARLARSGAERREPIGAELRRVAGLAGVTRAGVVDADKARGAKSGAEDGFLLGAEHLQLGGQEPHHLALRPPDLIRGERPAAVSTATIRSQVIWP